MLTTTTRIAIVVFGFLLILGGLGMAAMGSSIGFGGLGGLWLTVVGVALIVAVTVERNRYRSEAADREFSPSGPGGGEPVGAVDPRFQRTDEVFVDPTTGVRMRVLVDPGTGERRYVAEG
jgi:hypothetical protein